MKNNTPTYRRYREDYETAKSLGAAALACNAMMVPSGHPHLRLLFQNFQRPMVTNNDPTDVDYAGGLAAHVQGVPKTSFDGSVTVIETENGAIANFAQAIVDAGGHLPECEVLFGLSDGSSTEAVRVYKIFDVALTFSDGGGEIDASSRSQILTVQGQMRYMYFGDNADLGTAVANGSTLKGMAGVKNYLRSGAADQLLSSIVGAVGSQFSTHNSHYGI